MNEKQKLNIKEITLEGLSAIYNKIGYFSNTVSINDKVYLELLNSNNEVIYLVYLHSNELPLNIDNVNDIIGNINSSSYDKDFVNYMIISLSGYISESISIKGDDLNIYDMQKSNIRLEDKSYLEEILSIYNKEASNNKIELFSHNKIAYESIRKSFLSNKKVCVSHATGTGKTILISKCIEDFKDEEVLVLSSSNSILDYFASYNEIYNNNVKLMTYYKLSILTKRDMELLINSKPKLIVLDEYHRCGAPSWYNSVLELLSALPDSYILGTSATPVRYLDDARDMSNEIFDGNVVSTISLYDAIARNILPMPKYIVALYDFDEKINNLSNQIDKSKSSYVEKDELRRKIEVLKDRNSSSKYIEAVISKHISKEQNFIIFCKDLSHMRDMMPIVKGWFKNISNNSRNINIYELYSGNKNPLKELDRYLENIKGDDNSFNLLFTIDMLNEGVHAKNIDGVILLRPTISANIYYQQIGRAMSANSSSNPLIFDFVNNSDAIQTNTFYESIKEAICNLPKEIDSTNSFNIDYAIHHIYDETKDTLDLFLEIENNLTTSWDFMYDELYKHYEINDNVLVKKVENPKLYRWILRCIELYRAGKLEQYKIDKLNQIGFIWDRNEFRWEKNFLSLEDYFNTNGHTNISQEEDSSLFSWLKEQKLAKSKGKLEESKAKRLESIGVIWNLKEHIWNENYNIALEIKKYVGHLNLGKIKTYINSNSEEVVIDSKFRVWLTSQKCLIKSGKMRKDRLEKFKLLKVELIPKSTKYDALWRENIKKLLEYKSIHGHTNVPRDYKDKSLSSFVANIRNGKYVLSEERLKELEEIEFIWNNNEYLWDSSFNNLAKFVEKNGAIPPNAKTNPKENTWYYKQRQAYKAGKLRKDRLEKILSLGYVFE